MSQLLHRLPLPSEPDQILAEGRQLLDRQGDDLGLCPISGLPCGSIVSCRQWGCRTSADSLARGLQGVSAALELIGLSERKDDGHVSE